MSATATPPRPRRYLSADGLIDVLRNRLEDVPDHRDGEVKYSMVDCLMSAYAMFSLKDPSLLAFESRKDDQCLKNLYKLQSIPSDTQLRDTLDPVDVEQLNEAFADIFHEVQRAGVLKQYQFIDGHYLVAIDGTGHFCSTKISCPSCLQRKSRSGGVEYAHQAVAAVLIHPNRSEVIPLAVEPIVKQDGQTKNDCERNATRRLLKRVKQQHPKLNLVITEDGISSNAPHIRDLQKLGYHFILGAKPKDHVHLFNAVSEAGDRGDFHTVHVANIDKKNSYSEVSWANGLPLNASNEDIQVNFLMQSEFTSDHDMTKQFTWVTDLVIVPNNAHYVARGGRCRWRIENETFNTLKNQGYRFEHNYGHGSQNLATVLMVLMFLAFLVDQLQEAFCPLFKGVIDKFRQRCRLWEQIRHAVNSFVFRTWEQLFVSIWEGTCRAQPPPA